MCSHIYIYILLLDIIYHRYIYIYISYHIISYIYIYLFIYTCISGGARAMLCECGQNVVLVRFWQGCVFSGINIGLGCGIVRRHVLA